MYNPPFIINSRIVNLVSDISSSLERVRISIEKSDGVRLRKINRMKTIHTSLAIEGNSLTEEQVTALIEGKPVLAPLKEVQEVRNAVKAYNEFWSFDPYSQESLLKAHSIIAMGLVDFPGEYRRGSVCVAGREGISHIAPPAANVPYLMSDLFEWLEESEDNMLIKSSVFHYEFEYIHPFEDGNGRTGRFWQSRLLAEWNPVFEYVPIENMIWKNQSEYYKAIQDSTARNDSGIFIEFMLSMIMRTLAEHIEYAPINDPINDLITLLSLIKDHPDACYDDYARMLKVSSSTIKRRIAKLKEEGRIIRIGANKNGSWKLIDKSL